MRTVLRHQLSRKPFVTVANEVARDDRLSYAARGVLIAMLSRPTNWAFSAERLAMGSPRDGRKAVLHCMKELEAAGYLFRHRGRGRDGKLRTIVLVSDEPIKDWAQALSPESPNGTSVPESPHGTSVDGTSVKGTSKETQGTKPRYETQISSHSSIPPAGQDQEVRNPDSANAGSTAVDRDLDLAMDGWNRDRRRRKPWAELQRAYETGQRTEDDVLAWLAEMLPGGYRTGEESTAIGMLANGSHIKTIYNKISKDRRA